MNYHCDCGAVGIPDAKCWCKPMPESTDKRTPVCIYEVSVLQLRAGLDTNGNSRNAFMAVHPKEGVLFCVEELNGHSWFGLDGNKVLNAQIAQEPFSVKPAVRRTFMRAYTVTRFRERYRFVDREGNE